MKRLTSLAYLQIVVWTFLLDISQSAKHGTIEITNITCNSVDQTIVQVKRCSIDKIAVNKKAINVYLELRKKAESAELHIKLFRKINKVYKPFLYDDIIDVCDFLQSAKHHIFWGALLRSVEQYSNVNHSCPYENHLIVSNFIIDPKLYKAVPLPQGEYKIDIVTTVNNLHQVDFASFLTKY